MQTFLPLPPKRLDTPVRYSADAVITWSYEDTFKLLDRQRLGKQRVEALQIYQSLTGSGTVWANHPISKMWKDNKIGLLKYGLECCLEWKGRGYTDNIAHRFIKYIDHEVHLAFHFGINDRRGKLVVDKKFGSLLTGDVVHDLEVIGVYDLPWWMGDEEFHQSHRSNLLRKMPEHYRQYWSDEPDDIPYVWYA